ncbi:MAG: DUF3119 family protein [Phormidesmis sp.]
MTEPSASSSAVSTASTVLTPNYKLSIAILAIALLVLLLPVKTGGAGIVLILLGTFLLYQSATIRLSFTDTVLEVQRGDCILKTFPYADWQTWKIFWPAVPVLFYFKEVNSIHFLPVLFSPEELLACLETYCPDCALQRS